MLKGGVWNMDSDDEWWTRANEFETHAAATDQLDEDDLATALLGLVSEVGSLVSALKKRRRDTDSFFGYRNVVVEELGDVLWYTSAVARRGGTSGWHVLGRSGRFDRLRNAFTYS